VDFTVWLGCLIGFMGFISFSYLYYIDYHDRKLNDYFAINERVDISRMIKESLEYPKVTL